jgi:hypothetical protein
MQSSLSCLSTARTLAPVAVPAVMPLSWDFSAHRFALFGGVGRGLPEQGRNGEATGAWPRHTLSDHHRGLRLDHRRAGRQGIGRGIFVWLVLIIARSFPVLAGLLTAMMTVFRCCRACRQMPEAGHFVTR